MRTVLKNNHEVVLTWLEQSQPHGQNAQGSLFFMGTTIYSYGEHFPIARLIYYPLHESFTARLTNKKYSRTTSRHTALVNCALYRIPITFTDDVMGNSR